MKFYTDERMYFLTISIEIAGRFTTGGKMSQYPRGIELNDKGVPFKVQYEKKKSIKETIKWNRHKKEML